MQCGPGPPEGRARLRRQGRADDTQGGDDSHAKMTACQAPPLSLSEWDGGSLAGACRATVEPEALSSLPGCNDGSERQREKKKNLDAFVACVQSASGRDLSQSGVGGRGARPTETRIVRFQSAPTRWHPMFVRRHELPPPGPHPVLIQLSCGREERDGLGADASAIDPPSASRGLGVLIFGPLGSPDKLPRGWGGRGGHDGGQMPGRNRSSSPTT